MSPMISEQRVIFPLQSSQWNFQLKIEEIPGDDRDFSNQNRGPDKDCIERGKKSIKRLFFTYLLSGNPLTHGNLPQLTLLLFKRLNKLSLMVQWKISVRHKSQFPLAFPVATSRGLWIRLATLAWFPLLPSSWPVTGFAAPIKGLNGRGLILLEGPFSHLVLLSPRIHIQLPPWLFFYFTLLILLYCLGLVSLHAWVISYSTLLSLFW